MGTLAPGRMTGTVEESQIPKLRSKTTFVPLGPVQAHVCASPRERSAAKSIPGALCRQGNLDSPTYSPSRALKTYYPL